MSRTVVNLRDDLIKRIQRLTGLTKKVEIVNVALEQYARQKQIEKMMNLQGKIRWEGDLRKMRKGLRDSL